MEQDAKTLGRRGHPMLKAFPLRCLALSLVFDAAYFINRDPVLGMVSLWAVSAGIVGEVVLESCRLVSWLAALARSQAQAIRLSRAAGEVGVIILLVVIWVILVRLPDDRPTAASVMLSSAAFVLALVRRWISGEALDPLGMGFGT